MWTSVRENAPDPGAASGACSNASPRSTKKCAVDARQCAWKNATPPGPTRLHDALISIASDSEAPEYSTASTPARNSTSISGALGSATPGSERHSTKQNGFISWSVSRIARATVMLRTKRREGPGREGGREDDA